MMKGMFLGGFAAFVFVFAFEFLVHGFLMMGMYEASMSVWRPQAESNMAVMMLSQFLFAMAVAFFYPIVGPDKDCKKAIPFGFGLGLVLAMPQIASYSYLPIPFSISLAWAASSFVKALASTFIVAKIFNKLDGF
tara:strand:- start:6021 stop:6425 length:405 start_codon:yes stop_codon:yes gene_type:complete